MFTTHKKKMGHRAPFHLKKDTKDNKDIIQKLATDMLLRSDPKATIKNLVGNQNACDRASAMMDMIVVETQKQTQLTNTEENARDDHDEDDKLQKEMDAIDQQHKDMKKKDMQQQQC